MINAEGGEYERTGKRNKVVRKKTGKKQRKSIDTRKMESRERDERKGNTKGKMISMKKVETIVKEVEKKTR